MVLKGAEQQPTKQLKAIPSGQRFPALAIHCFDN
jgi:hypothetical protein